MNTKTALWLLFKKARGYRVFTKDSELMKGAPESRCAVKGVEIDTIVFELLRAGWEEV